MENIVIEIKKLTDWERVVDAARFTQRKEGLGKEPSQEFKKQMIISEHSPLRLMEFDIKVYNIPYCNMGALRPSCSCSTIREYVKTRYNRFKGISPRYATRRPGKHATQPQRSGDNQHQSLAPMP